MNDTDAATEWRKILGGNDRANPVLPLSSEYWRTCGQRCRRNWSRCG